MSTIVSPLHRHFTPLHLDEVAREMQRLGAPRLRAYFDAVSGAWLSREGTHRLRCSFVLGLAPVLTPIAWWRSLGSLRRARFAAREYGYEFPVVHVAATS